MTGWRAGKTINGMPPPHTLLSIQYLRGLAAVAVVVHHTGRIPTGLGQAGVDVFFVISGFIMVHVSGREPLPLAFLRARMVRLVPLYWLMTLTTATVTGVTDTRHTLLSLVFWPHVAANGAWLPLLAQGWSLNLEVQFYILFATTLLLPERHRLPALTATIATLAGLTVAVSCMGGDSEFNYFPIVLEFLGGAWLCQAWQRGWVRRLPAGLLLTAGLALLAMQAQWPMPVPWRCLQWGVPALLIVTGALAWEASGRLPAVQGLRALGDASYSLYLTHILLLFGLHRTLKPMPAILAVPGAILACAAIALLVHRLVERPLGQALRPARPLLLPVG